MDDNEECECDDQIYGEYCSEACDGSYVEWKAKMKKEFLKHGYTESELTIYD